MNNIRTIGVLTSGGDAPGMNAAVRAVTRTAINKGYRVMGIMQGYKGLIDGDIQELTLRNVSNTLHRGGTFLGTARCKEFTTLEGQLKAAERCREYNIDAVVVIGGDGSFRGAMDLSAQGIFTVGIPGTIDNDIACTEYTIGFDTALNTAMEAIDKVRDTMASHQRCSVVEVMGRHAGYIATEVAIATGAEVLMIPEKEYDVDKDVVGKILEAKSRGKNHYIVILAEGIGGAGRLAEKIEDDTGIITRASVLGYIQRGGNPTVRDRVIASKMGYHAVNILENVTGSRIVVYKKGTITDVDMTEGLSQKKSIDEFDVEMAEILAM